ncbi:decarboxylase [Sphingobium sp. C100]|uniref:type III PLP-dependent enzyme n=1 Tax=Sphingobium sp. C100 TaxID=1207055 RepID=UPI0003D6238E|nr:type III PLP-dependent enzyme [Sphingobium sp. C100]ETI63032.1 decarboxylase [Sphingobium sp. C100]
MHKHLSALGVATTLKPAAPVTLIRPQAAVRAARFFAEKFPGRSLYAVKANPSPDLIRTLFASGITHFDVASIAEVRLVTEALADAEGQAKLCFMHPVKAEEAIAEAYHIHGVRTFSLDTIDELEKIMRATNDATDLELCVRLRVSSEHSELSLASKFGAELGETRELLMATRQAADALGICFHVGSQAMSPQAYSDAIERVRAAIVDAAVTVDIIDVGGGFPSVYPGMQPVALEHYFDAIHRGFESLPVSYSSELWCEPGRALSAEYSSVVVRVERRRGNELYINDGAYGALFDAAHIGWRFPVELLRDDVSMEAMEGFSFYGPTCDDMDHMVGPFMLPGDVKAGDYIEIGMLGAYGAAMRTGFNGFTSESTIEVEDEPMASLYTVAVPQRRRANVIKLG